MNSIPICPPRTLVAAVIAATLAFATSTSHAATVTWDGSGDATWTGPSDATSWSGSTYNDGDDAQFLGAGAGTVSISGTVNPGSIDVSTAAGVDYTITGGDIGGAAILTKNGASRLFLDSPNTYTGETFINGGEIQISHGDALGSTAGSTTISSSLRIADDITTAEPITIAAGAPNGSIRGVGAGGTFTGLITLEDGNSDMRGSNLTFQGGFASVADQSLGFNGSNYIVDTNPILLNNGTFGVTSAGNNPANATQINVGGNDWGLTTINFNGYLKVGGTDFLPTDTQVRFGFNWWNRSPGTLDLNGNDQTVRALGHFALGLGADNKVTGLAGDVLTINLDSGSTYNTYEGRFEGGLSIVKNGDGTLILENLSSTTAPANPSSVDPSPGPAIPSTNTGTFTINAGVVESRAGYGATDAITFSDASKVIVAGGTLDLNYAGTDTIAALDLGSGFVADGVYDSTDPSGLITGTGSLTVDSTLLTVTWDGSTDSTWTNPDATSWSGDTYVDGQQASFGDTGAGPVTISGTVAPGGITVNNSAGNDYSFDGGTIGGTASLTKSGDGNLSLTGANTYSGTTTINQGRIDISNNDALGSAAGNTVVNGDGGNNDGLRIGGGITTSEPITIGASAGVGSITGINVGGTTGGTFTGAITLEDGGTDFRGNGLKFQGGITSVANQGLSFNGSSYEVDTNPIVLNDGAFTVTSAGNNKANALQLNVGGNDWGFMRINFGGYLLLGGANFLPADAGVEFGWSNTGNSTATLDLNGFDQTVASIAQSSNSLGNAGDVNITGGGTLTVDQASDTEYQGRITDGATPTALVKAGAGTLVLNNLSGTPNDYVGGTTVSAGTLSLGDGTTGTDLPDNGSVSVAGGATLDLNYSGTDTIGALDLGSGFVADGIWGSAGSGAPNTNAALTGTGTLTVDSTLLEAVWDGSSDSSWTSPDSTSWSGATYNDGQGVSFFNTGAGTVTISGTVAPGSVAVANSAGNDYTFTGDSISGSTTLAKSGGGNLTLTNVNTFTGNMSVDDGAIIVSGAGQLGSGNYAGDIAINGDGLFEYGGTADQTLAGLVSGGGSGGLLKTDTSTLDVLMKDGTYTGPTSVNGGTLRFINEADLRVLGSSSLSINNGSTLEFFSDVGGANRTQLNNKTFTFGSSGGGTLNFSKGNHLFQGGGNTHNFVTTGGSMNTVSSSNGGFMNMQGAGTLDFDVADGPDPVDLAFTATFNNGSITKNGAGTMSLTAMINSAFGTNDITVNEGTLSVGDGTNSTDLADIGTVSVASGATLELNYSGTDTVNKLFLGGVQVNAGVYGSSDPSGLLTGTGTLTVTTGPGVPNIIDIEIDGSGNVILTLDGSEAGLTAQQSNDLTDGSFSDVASTPGTNTLTIDAADVDPNADGSDFYRVRN